jgi:hypothetical protein
VSSLKATILLADIEAAPSSIALLSSLCFLAAVCMPEIHLTSAATA